MAADELLSLLGRYRLIVFDCDGTLIDSQHNIIAAVEKVFHSIDLAPPERSLIRRQVGLPPEAAIAAMLPLADAALHQRVADAFRRLRPQLQAEKRPLEPLYPGISALIDQLQHPELFLGIATGKGRPGLDIVLEQHAMGGYFHTLQTGDRCRGKPDPEMLERALDETGLTADAAVMVGDTSFDMAMAQAAGVKAIGVSWGYHTAADLWEAGAHAVIDQPSELPAILRQLDQVIS
jgi:phosphoglycolate phosphatase